MSERRRARTKAWLPMAAVAIGLGLPACGEAGKGAAQASRAPFNVGASGVTLPQPELKSDAELDSDSYPGEPDNDNNHVFGHAAGAADARAATALVKRYYAAAAASDGRTACSLIYSVFAESIPEVYGRLAGLSSGTGRGCAVVMSKLFERHHAQLSPDNATLKVAAVRVRGKEASVLLSFEREKPRYYLELFRERGAWKIDRLTASEQPIYVE